MTRLAEPGPAVRARVRLLLREMRAHVRTTGRLPKIDSEDADLQRAWIELGRHLEHNAKIDRRAFARSVAGMSTPIL